MSDYEPCDNVKEFSSMSEEEIGCTLFEQLDSNITTEEINKAIGQLKSGKAAAEDMWINELFKYKKKIPSLQPVLLNLFNCILSKGHFPSAWSKGIVMPLHKKGDIQNPDNYRGITLLSVTGKIRTHILNKHLQRWAEEAEFWDPGQAGF